MKKIVVIFSLFLIFASTAFAQQKIGADVLYRNKQYVEAIKVCEKDLAANPRNIDAYCYLLWSLNMNKQYAEAEARAIEARKINSTDIRLVEALAEALYYQGKNSGALEMFQLYIATAPESASDVGWSYNYMGEIYIRQGKYQHADMAFSAAVQFDPLRANWWYRCGYAREMAGNYELSLAAYEKAISLNSKFVDAMRGKERVSAKIR